jgi:hypothetical protein
MAEVDEENNARLRIDQEQKEYTQMKPLLSAEARRCLEMPTDAPK